MTHQLVIRDMTRRERILNAVVSAAIVFRRKYIPYLVFYGQEVNARMTFKENKLHKNSSPDHAIGQFYSGHLFEIEKMIGEIGIDFDRGIGFDGRDWELDWSLKGPISLIFRGPCKTKEKRT